MIKKQPAAKTQPAAAAAKRRPSSADVLIYKKVDELGEALLKVMAFHHNETMKRFDSLEMLIEDAVEEGNYVEPALEEEIKKAAAGSRLIDEKVN